MRSSATTTRAAKPCKSTSPNTKREVMEMDHIDHILRLIDWRSSPVEQAAGISLAEKEADITSFLQPCTERYSKNVWDNCALIVSKRPDAELLPYLPQLLTWLQDMNWPGAFRILTRLQNYTDAASLTPALDACLQKAQAAGDQVWLDNLQLLKRT